MVGRSNIIRVMIVLAVICTVFLAYIPAVQAVSQPLIIVETFKEDKVHLDIGETTHVTRTLIIQNKINKSIVPGMITLDLQKRSQDKFGPIPIPFTSSIKAVNVSNVKAHMGDDTPINDVWVIENNRTTTIQYGVWVPIDPGEAITVVLDYDSSDIVEKGILFNTFYYPFTSSSIPIEKAIIETSLDNGHVTYASEMPDIYGDTYVWEKSQIGMDTWGVSAEYSILPLPMLPFPGSLLMWSLIILTCFVIFMVWIYTRPHRGA